MTVTDCRVCRGRGEIPQLRLAWCCGGRNAWGEVVCACGGGRIPEAFAAPCPRGCDPGHAPAPLAPCVDPDCW